MANCSQKNMNSSSLVAIQSHTHETEMQNLKASCPGEQNMQDYDKCVQMLCSLIINIFRNICRDSLRQQN
jgi:hypothetical protein